MAVLAALWFAASGAAPAADGAVALVYHHVDADSPASTSVTPAQFAAHLDYLAANDFNVLPLARIVAALRSGEPLPPRTVAITFDDAYASVHSTALPMLARRGYPFTVFVATDAVDDGLGGYMGWRELRGIVAGGGDVQNHSAGHGHLVRRRAGEDESAWRRRVREDLVRAQARIEAELGLEPTLFAYPYGEYDAALAALVADLGLTGIGQHSGAAHAGALDGALPRFPVNRAYAGLDSLADKLNSLPLAVTRIAPRDGVLGPGGGPPELVVELDDDGLVPGAMRCFVAGQPAAEVTWQGRRATVRARAPLPPGRSKYTCTMPSRSEPGRYHWRSFLWIKPHPDGRWYDD